MKLSNLCDIKFNFADADFWILAKGSENKLGMPIESTEEYKNKKVAIIFGKDKPTLFFSPQGKMVQLPDGRIELNGFYFRDTPVLSYASTEYKRNLHGNIKRIDFYWDPEFPEILLNIYFN